LEGTGIMELYWNAKPHRDFHQAIDKLIEWMNCDLINLTWYIWSLIAFHSIYNSCCFKLFSLRKNHLDIDILIVKNLLLKIVLELDLFNDTNKAQET
jgi:hypothetical protein